MFIRQVKNTSYNLSILCVSFLCVFFLTCLSYNSVAQDNDKLLDNNTPWRIRFVEAAVVQGDRVLLGEVAVVIGDMPESEWLKLAALELWPSPKEKSRPVTMTRPKLQEAVVRTMKDLAPYCLFPSSMAIQRGGVVLDKAVVQEKVVKALTPLLASLPGESSFTDFRLPNYVFMQHAGQEIEIEPQKTFAPGRVNVRLTVKEMDGRPVQKYTGSVFVDSWVDVPCATSPLNKDEVLEAAHVGFMRVNLAHTRGVPWDGRGGPWRLVRPVGVEQVIFQDDLAHIPTIKKGTAITVLYISNNITLRTQGEALKDGSVGEAIPIKNVQTKKEFYAVIQDPLTVVISTR